MEISEIIIIGIGLAMDAFAVSICKGLSIQKLNFKKIFIIGLYFGLFQMIMPILGYGLGNSFQSLVSNIDHWVVFVLLLIIGINMIKEAFDDEDEKKNEALDIKTMLLLAIATSIDAFAVGITFALFEVNVIISVIIIGVITFCISMLGVMIGNKFGDRFQNKSEFIGGVILIIIGVKILLEHLNFF